MKKILVAYDGDIASRRALNSVVEIAAAMDVTTTVVSVVPAASNVDGDDNVPLWDNEAVHRRMVAEACEYLASRGVTAASLVTVGDPSTEIDRIAREHGFDTIVVGANAVHTLSFSSGKHVSGDIARRAAATVIIAR